MDIDTSNMSFGWNEFPGPFDMAFYNGFYFEIVADPAGGHKVDATWNGVRFDLEFIDACDRLPEIGVPVCLIHEDVDVAVFCGFGWKLYDDAVTWLYGPAFWAELPSRETLIAGRFPE